MNIIEVKDRLNSSPRRFLVPIEPSGDAVAQFRLLLEGGSRFVTDSEGVARACARLDPASIEGVGSIPLSSDDSGRSYTFDGYPLSGLAARLTCPSCGGAGQLHVASGPEGESYCEIVCTACGTRRRQAAMGPA
jgi:hypothetical protein